MFQYDYEIDGNRSWEGFGRDVDGYFLSLQQCFIAAYSDPSRDSNSHTYIASYCLNGVSSSVVYDSDRTTNFNIWKDDRIIYDSAVLGHLYQWFLNRYYAEIFIQNYFLITISRSGLSVVNLHYVSNDQKFPSINWKKEGF